MMLLNMAFSSREIERMGTVEGYLQNSMETACLC
jgi:hypothetical protein